MVGVKIAPAFGAKKCYFISTQLRPRNSAIGSNMHIKIEVKRSLHFPKRKHDAAALTLQNQHYEID